MAAEDYRITLEQASAMTKNWRESDHNINLKGFIINREAIDAIMATEGVEQLRIYFAIEEGKNKLVYVGADAEGKNIISHESGESAIYDLAKPCPTWCDESSPLETD